MGNVWLVGMMGVGKSTVGRLVAEQLGRVFVDMDARISERAGCSIATLWGRDGEEAFRDMETVLVQDLAAEGDLVIATGGGVVLRSENTRAMHRSGRVVWLDADVETLSSRASPRHRPLLAESSQPRDELAKLAGARAELYQAASQVRIATDDLDAAAVAAKVISAVSATGDVAVLHDAETEILIGGSVADGEILPRSTGRRRVAILCQPTTASLGRAIKRRLASSIACDVRILPDRDAAKTLDVASDVYAWLNELGLTRADTVVGVGGGATTDLTGFVAGTYLRGIEAVYVPTTLLGAVDASIGGKTGVNVGGKNLVGVFKRPSRVVIDTTILEGLPSDILLEGAAEALKAGMIADPVIVDLYERERLAAPVGEVVRRAIQVKLDVVAEDFREQGRRALLNYGHTVGHAVEIAAAETHGRSVAIGMVAAAAASRHVLGFQEGDRHDAIIAGLGLPVSVGGLDRRRVLELLQLDKKRDAAGTRMVLLEAIAKPIVRSVDSATVGVALDAVLT